MYAIVGYCYYLYKDNGSRWRASYVGGARPPIFNLGWIDFFSYEFFCRKNCFRTSGSPRVGPQSFREFFLPCFLYLRELHFFLFEGGVPFTRAHVGRFSVNPCPALPFLFLQHGYFPVKILKVLEGRTSRWKGVLDQV